jgi:hypothetical protein
MKVTRRQLAAALAASTLANRSSAQTGDDPAELRKQASERLRRNAETLRKAALPMAAEPAFSFKA